MLYFLPYLVILISSIGIWSGNAPWTGFIILFVLFPIIEWLFKNAKLSQKTTSSDFAVLSMPFALSIFLGLSLWTAKFTGDPLQISGIIFSSGAIIGGFGITSAHELIHRRKKWQRALGVYNLTLVNFAYWGVEHVFGHHKLVSTPSDTATARVNESLYHFFVRNYLGLNRGCLKLEPKKYFTYWSLSLINSLLVFHFLGLKVLLIWGGISAVAILLLLSVDYIEHYGLLRSQDQAGNYLAFKPEHSWDTESPLTNYILFNLGRHSAHHQKASLAFSSLGSNSDAKQLPYGYSVMILISLLPPIYFRIMKKLV